jgi:hypothetical protein
MSTTFEDVQESDDVGLGKGVRIAQRMTDADLCRQVDNIVEAVRGKQFRHNIAICDIPLLEMEVRESGEFVQAGILQVGVIVGIKIVERDDGTAIGKQTSRDVKTDKASRASDQNRFHRYLRSCCAAATHPIETAFR